MSFRIFKEDAITPSNRTINVRNYLDSSGPHKVAFGIRTVVADGTAGFCEMLIQYETPNGELRSIEMTNPADLRFIADINGAMWYSPTHLTIDKYYPNADGPNSSNPYGVFIIAFNLSGSAGNSKISYECIVDVYDNTPAVTYIP